MRLAQDKKQESRAREEGKQMKSFLQSSAEQLSVVRSTFYVVPHPARSGRHCANHRRQNLGRPLKVGRRPFLFPSHQVMKRAEILLRQPHFATLS